MRRATSIICTAFIALILCLGMPVPARADIAELPPDEIERLENEYPRELTKEEYEELSDFIKENYTGIHYDEKGVLVDENGTVVLDEEAFIIDESGAINYPKAPDKDIEEVQKPTNGVQLSLALLAGAIVISAVSIALILTLKRKRDN